MPYETRAAAAAAYLHNTELAANCQVDLGQPLEDYSSSGHALPWAEHRAESDLLAMLYDQINPDKANRLRCCAPRLLYQPQPDGSKKLHTAWFCRVRLCPVCQWRRSLKAYGQLAEVVKALDAERVQQYGKPYGWILLTLTVRNVHGEQLPAELDKLSAAWHRLIKRQEYRKAIKGYLRSCEITHNTNPNSRYYDTYHPHYHVLLAVNPSYFTSRAYLSFDAWQQLWAECARLPYAPSIEVHRVKGATPKALAEIAKYACKPSDYINPSDLDMSVDTLRILDAAVHKRRLISWGGVLREMHHRLNLDDTETGDLIHTGEGDPAATGTPIELIAYSWSAGHHQYYREEQPCRTIEYPKGYYPPIIQLPPTTGGKSSNRHHGQTSEQQTAAP